MPEIKDIIELKDLSLCNYYRNSDGKYVHYKPSHVVTYLDECFTDLEISTIKTESIPLVTHECGEAPVDVINIANGGTVTEVYSDLTKVYVWNCPDQEFTLLTEYPTPHIFTAEAATQEIEFDCSTNTYIIKGYKTTFNVGLCQLSLLGPDGEVILDGHQLACSFTSDDGTVDIISHLSEGVIDFSVTHDDVTEAANGNVVLNDGIEVSGPITVSTDTPSFISIVKTGNDIKVNYIDPCIGVIVDSNLCQICVAGVVIDSCDSNSACDGSGNCAPVIITPTPTNTPTPTPTPTATPTPTP